MGEGQRMAVADVAAQGRDVRLEHFVRAAVELVAREIVERARFPAGRRVARRGRAGGAADAPQWVSPQGAGARQRRGRPSV
jgi:hypothetical protein